MNHHKCLTITMIMILLSMTTGICSSTVDKDEALSFLMKKDMNLPINGPELDQEWNKTFGGINDEYAVFDTLEQTLNNEFLIFAQTHSFGSGGKDIWFLKTDLDGNVLLNKTYGGINDDWPGRILETSDGGYIFTGTTFSFGNGQSDLWLVKTNSQGNIQWNKTMGGSGNEWGSHLFITADNGYFIAGRTDSSGAGSYDNWLIKTDENGNIIWQKTLGGRGSEWLGFMIQTSDGGYASIGYTSDASFTDFDMQLIKLDENGNEVWSQTYDSKNLDMGHGVCQCSDGGYMLTGLTTESWTSEYDMLLVKTDPMGNELWSKTLGGKYYDVGNTILPTVDDNYVLTGSLDSDLCILKINDEGDILYSYKIGGNGDDSGGDLMYVNGGDYIVSGHTNSFGHGGYDVWLLKLSIPENNPPYKPSRPSGSSSGNINKEYTYVSSTIDPDEDVLYYLFDWGDGTSSDWSGPIESGEEFNASHTWSSKGNYEIKVKAKDIYGAESSWSDPLPITMPYSYKPIPQILELLFQRFPHAFPILKQRLG